MNEVTIFVERVQQGDPRAADELLATVYEELRRLASRKIQEEAGGLTLQPTALVHEAWLRLGGDEQPTWENRAHFFGAAAEAIGGAAKQGAEGLGTFLKWAPYVVGGIAVAGVTTLVITAARR